MTRHAVTIVDYGIGNLYSVRRALETVGAEVTMASDAAGIAAAERLVLPGVGAFADGMQGLRARGLVDPIRDHAASGRPLLGICLGMQMLASVSEEFGRHEGLGVIPGRVVAVPDARVDGTPHKIPNIGWRALRPFEGGSWADTLLADTELGATAYLVHSFHLLPKDGRDALAWCDYGGHRVVAAVARGGIAGCQFHPEKSGTTGLGILARFVCRGPRDDR